MLDRDRTFLTDFVQFGYMHHVVVAQSLYEVWRHPDAAAARKRAAVDRLDMTAAAQMAEELNDAVRMQRIAAARMYSQMAASIEDFGALCSAVRNRRMENAGAFKRYLYGEPSEVGSFFDFVREQPNGDLRTYLKFPSLQGLKHRLEAADYQAFVHDYSSLADTIRTTADMWRTVAQPSAMSQALAPGWENDVNIILDIIDPGQPPSQVSQSLMNAAHNKIKH